MTFSEIVKYCSRPSEPLTPEDRELAVRLIKAGCYNHHIAAWFGVNPGRIAELKNEVGLKV